MRLWMALVAAGVVALAAAVLARRRWLARERLAAEARIARNRAVAKPGFAIADDSLRVKTNVRRQAAEQLRARAAHVESGASAAQVLRVVKR